MYLVAYSYWFYCGSVRYNSVMKVLVAGGAGFIGSHLCDALIAKEYDVICVDNFITGNDENIKHLINNAHFTFLQHDISIPLTTIPAVEQVYHLASPASPNHHSSKSYHSLPFETMRANSLGTWNLVELALRNNASFLYTSTSEVYGDPLEHPQKETYRGNVSSTGPRSVYDEAKRFGETIVMAHVRSKQLNGRIVRLFNTYGPRMAPDDGRAVIAFVTAALQNKPMPIFGDGKQTRSFCYVADTIRGIILAMEIPEANGEVINIGNPYECTIASLALEVKSIIKSQSEIVHNEPLPEDDPLRRLPAIEKAQSLLHWQPTVSLEDGLQKLINYIKTNQPQP